MKRTLLLILTLSIVGLSGFETPTQAQGPNNTTGTKMIYHDGQVMTGLKHVYLIWYGCWSAACGNPDGAAAQSILTDQFRRSARRLISRSTLHTPMAVVACPAMT